MEPITPIATIRTLAQASAECGQNVLAVNPYPEGTAAHACFERDFWVARNALLETEGT